MKQYFSLLFNDNDPNKGISLSLKGNIIVKCLVGCAISLPPDDYAKENDEVNRCHFYVQKYSSLCYRVNATMDVISTILRYCSCSNSYTRDYSELIMNEMNGALPTRLVLFAVEAMSLEDEKHGSRIVQLKTTAIQMLLNLMDATAIKWDTGATNLWRNFLPGCFTVSF